MQKNDGSPLWDIKTIQQQCIFNIIEFFNENGRVISSREWDNLKYQPTRGTIKKYFGVSFNDFVKNLGFTETNPTPRTYTKDELIDFLKKLNSKLGRTPTTDDIKDNPEYPSLSTFYRYFNSFTNALSAADLTFHRGYTAKFLIEKIREFVSEYGRPPYNHEFDSKNRPKKYPKKQAFARVFGSMEEAVRQAGFKLVTIGRNKIWNGEKIKIAVKEQVNHFLNEKGRVPSRLEWDNLFNSPSRYTIRNELGLTFNQLLSHLGFEPLFKSPHKYDKEELIQYLRAFYEEFEKVPTADDLRNHPDRYPNPSNYQKQFGTFDNAIRMAGFDSNKFLNEEFLKSEIHRFIKEHG